MSYLSTFLGANAQGYSGFNGIPSRNVSNAWLDIATYLSGTNNNGIISWNSGAATNNLSASFYNAGSNRSVTFYGYSQVNGIGNARFETNGQGWLFDFSNTLVINTINFAAGGGAGGNFTNNTSTFSLTAVYNLGLRGKYSFINCTAFTNFPSLTTVTVSEISLNSSSSTNISFYGCALTAQSIENILVAADAGCPSAAAAAITLSGGTNSGAGALTAAAAAARTSLIAKGCTVTLNP